MSPDQNTVDAVAERSGSRRILYPELWPAELRAVVILVVAVVAIYSGSWDAPIIERPANGAPLSKLLYELGQSMGGADTRPYHAVTMLLHLLSATLLFGILYRILTRFGHDNSFVPACLGALAWAVHPALTEAVVAPSRGGAVLGGIIAFAAVYGLVRAAESKPRTRILIAGAGVLLAVAWVITTRGHFLAGTKLAVWPSPLIYDHGTSAGGRTFEEANLYGPLALLAGFVAFLAAMLRPRHALLVWVLPLTALGMMARARTLDYRGALVLWRDTVAKSPANPRAHRELARASLAAGLAREAIVHFERALALAPGEGRIRLELAAGLMTLGRVGDAVRHYEIVGRELPKDPAARLEHAVALTILGRDAEADIHYRSALAFGISEAEQHRRRGRALAERGDFETAEAELEAALRAEPGSGETRVILGMVLSAMGRSAEGMKHFVAAVELNPSDASAHASLGDALLEDLRPAEALPHYEAALRLAPARGAMLHASLGQALGRLGRATEAIAHLEAALALNPENVEARANLELIRAAVQRHADKK
jgi:tetratricopeptide (TPR) repeat protein